MAKTGWDRPLRIEVAVRLPELASSMQRGFDASGLQRRSGALRAYLGKLSTYKVARTASKTKVRITVTIPLAYAQILDEGGTTPAVEGKRMRMPWGWRMRKKPSVIRPFEYVRKGADDFIERYAVEGGVSVKWRN